MTRVRLLPIVVLAAIALLVFKSIGIVTSGGYVLLGVETVSAAGGGGGDHGAPEAHGEPQAEGTLVVPNEPMLTDVSPTLTDSAPTMGPTADGHGAPADGGHGDAADAGHEPAGHDAEGADGANTAQEESEGGPAAQTAAADCSLIPTAEGCPLAEGAGAGTEGQLSPTERLLLQRLGERRTELDTREAELDLRTSLIEAAEKRLAASKTELAELEARIAALSEQQRAAEDGQLKSLAGMYETMRPGDAAKIFEALDGVVLVRIARTMNPRKLSAVLAKMSAERARGLTAELASSPKESEAESEESDDPYLDLPQIAAD